MFAKDDPFVVWMQSLREITEDKRIEEVEETSPEDEEDKHPHHGDMNGMKVPRVKDRHKQNAQLPNHSTYDADDGKPRLFVGYVWLQLLHSSQHILHQQSADKEDQLEPCARNEQRLQVCSANVTDVHWVLVCFAHKPVDGMALDGPCRHQGNEHAPPHYERNKRYEIVVDFFEPEPAWGRRHGQRGK